MALFIILGSVVLITVIVLGVLFYMLAKESQVKPQENAVPLTDLSQLKKDFSSGIFEQKNPKDPGNLPEIIPAFVPKPVVSPAAESVGPKTGEEKNISLADNMYKKRAEELEDELQTILKKSEGQSDEARKMIETLTRENEELKTQKTNLEQAQVKLTEVQGAFDHLKTENTGLQANLDTVNARVQSLEAEMATVKSQMAEEISRANQTVVELTKEKEALLSVPIPPADETLRHELDFLKIEHIQLKQDYENLQKSNEQLQYELIKARAQSSGLERVSFNYKNQLEDFFKKVNSVEVSNVQLSQVKNRLEGQVQEIKSQNEELLKKDQLAQFELEKNRSRLLALEREYEDLKARVQQNNQ